MQEKLGAPSKFVSVTVLIVWVLVVTVPAMAGMLVVLVFVLLPVVVGRTGDSCVKFDRSSCMACVVLSLRFPLDSNSVVLVIAVVVFNGVEVISRPNLVEVVLETCDVLEVVEVLEVNVKVVEVLELKVRVVLVTVVLTKFWK